MIRRYQLTTTTMLDAEVTIEVDHDKLTPDLASEINAFWSGADDRLAEVDGDSVQAVIRIAGETFLRMVVDVLGHDVEGMQREFNEREGWPLDGEHGIKLVDYDGRPDFGYYDVEVTEVER